MKARLYTYISLISAGLFSCLMLFNWFTIEAMGTCEKHSFVTIPSMLNEGADFLTQLGGKTVAIAVIIMSAVLEYMCILSFALGLWGIYRSVRLRRKSRLSYFSQLIALFLESVALISMLLINVVSKMLLGGIISIVPTFWFVFALAMLVLSFFTGVKSDLADFVRKGKI